MNYRPAKLFRFFPDGWRGRCIRDIQRILPGGNKFVEFIRRQLGKMPLITPIVVIIHIVINNNKIAGGYVGTGLGLAITKQLVDLLNGKIEFTSKQGKGTTFVIELPFKLDFSKEDSMERGEEASCDLNGKKLLLVEDNELNMEISKYILEEEEAIVDTALDGKQAVEQFSKSQEGEYCLILMDIMMPVMNGYEATKIIRKMDRADAKSIPIFAMSANAFPEDIKESIKAGMNRHLSKPLDINHFLKAVYSVMKG